MAKTKYSYRRAEPVLSPDSVSQKHIIQKLKPLRTVMTQGRSRPSRSPTQKANEIYYKHMQGARTGEPNQRCNRISLGQIYLNNDIKEKSSQNYQTF